MESDMQQPATAIIPITDEELERGATADGARMEVGPLFFRRCQARIQVHQSVVTGILSAIESAGAVVMEDMAACASIACPDGHNWQMGEVQQRHEELRQTLNELGEAAQALRGCV